MKHPDLSHGLGSGLLYVPRVQLNLGMQHSVFMIQTSETKSQKPETQIWLIIFELIFIVYIGFVFLKSYVCFFSTYIEAL